MMTRSLKEVNLQRSEEELSINNFREIMDMEDEASGVFDRMMGVTWQIYDNTCPVKFLKPRKRESRKPWITIEILKVSNIRNQVYVEYLNSECAKKLEEFK